MTNIEIVKELLVNLAILVPLATGLTMVIKGALGINSETPKSEKRYVPVISVVVGGVCGALLIGVSIPAIVVGIIAGLSGIGLWEVGKTSVAGK